jgi:hypothetical protein
MVCKYDRACLFREPRTSREPVTGRQIVSVGAVSRSNRTQQMKDFSNASFSPDLIKAMEDALEGALATLPYPVSSMRVQNIAESILRSAKQGERNPRTLQTMALMEMQIRTDGR